MLSRPPRCNKRKFAQRARISLLSAWRMRPIVNIGTQSASKYANQIMTTHFPPLCLLNSANRHKKNCSNRLRRTSALIFHVSYSFSVLSKTECAIFFIYPTLSLPKLALARPSPILDNKLRDAQ
ncbi:hypothetical protein SLA2020_219610 [Shorea laevis]